MEHFSTELLENVVNTSRAQELLMKAKEQEKKAKKRVSVRLNHYTVVVVTAERARELIKQMKERGG